MRCLGAAAGRADWFTKVPIPISERPLHVLRKSRNWSKLVPPGESRTTSPGRATLAASWTASPRLLQRSKVCGSGPVACCSAASIFSAASPKSTTWSTRWRTRLASSSQGRFLSRPPRSRTIGSVKERMAAMVRSGAVAMESLYHWAPFHSRTNSSRWATPRNSSAAERMASSGRPAA